MGGYSFSIHNITYLIAGFKQIICCFHLPILYHLMRSINNYDIRITLAGLFQHGF